MKLGNMRANDVRSLAVLRSLCHQHEAMLSADPGAITYRVPTCVAFLSLSKAAGPIRRRPTPCRLIG
jgi:hypothetical protein